MIFGVVPAGGKSKRMGRPKLSLPFRDRTVLECVLNALRLGGCDATVVVLGKQAAELEPLARQAGAHICMLPEDTADMRATVEVGLYWLQREFGLNDKDAWLLAPADFPALDWSVVAALRYAYLANPGYSIIVPTCGGLRGHPVLLSWRHAEGLQAHTPGQGLNTYLRLHSNQTLELAVEKPGILADVDTPQDYERLLG
jgi:molybdenum cofactor cytidylyltransferase